MTHESISTKFTKLSYFLVLSKTYKIWE